MSHASIYDEEFLTVREAASEVGISLTQFRDLLAFDAAKGRPGEESQFPNAYKATPAINSPIRIPVRDMRDYKRRRAATMRTPDGEVSVFDLPYKTVRETAEELRVSIRTVRTILDFDPLAERPAAGSAFPLAYKPTPAINSPIRIPVRDIERYKRTRTGEPHPIGYDFAAASGNGSGEVVFAEVSPA